MKRILLLTLTIAASMSFTAHGMKKPAKQQNESKSQTTPPSGLNRAQRRQNETILLDAACDHNWQQVIAALQKPSIEGRFTDEQGNTTLMHALKETDAHLSPKEKVAVVTLLLAASNCAAEPIDHTNNAGETPEGLVAQSKNNNLRALFEFEPVEQTTAATSSPRYRHNPYTLTDPFILHEAHVTPAQADH